MLGWVGGFILGISLYVLPKFRGLRLASLPLAWLCWALWNAGVALRWLAGVAVIPARCLLPSAALLLLAFALSQYLLVWAPARAARAGGRERRARDLGTLLGIAGFCGLGLALIVNLAGAVAASPTAAYPVRLDHWLVDLELWVFILPVALGYSTRFVSVFLGLRPVHTPAPARMGATARGVAAALVALAVAAGFGPGAVAAAVALALAAAGVWTLRIFEPAARPAKREGVYGGYPAFLRLAYAWLLAGAALGLVAELRDATGLLGAARHAVTVGFIATLIFALGPRILPSFLNSRQLFSAKLMGASLWLLAAGCLLRVVTESAAYGAPGDWAWRWLPVSAFVELAAVLLFAVNLALTLAQSPPAWFRMDAIQGEMPLAWCLGAYPGTRRLLRRAGLCSLARFHRPPRSLTLAEAAQADHAELEPLLRELRAYFAVRRPRRP